MGCCCPKDAKTKEVNKALKKDRDIDKFVKKLLFLGSGGSGKSTLFKQLRTIHGQGFKEEDRRTFTDHIHAQIIEQMKMAIECVEIIGENAAADAAAQEQASQADEYKEPQHKGLLELSENGRLAVDIVNAVKEPKVSRPRLTNDIAEAIKMLWAEAEIKNIYNERAIMKIEDSSAYFWDRIDAVMDENYVPTETDILLVRYRTTGVIEQTFTIEKNTFHVFDVGGQKSERKKWINCFENVTAVIFVAALSCYNEVMFELEDVNSMDDTLILFEDICNNEWFTQTSMILFLNKQDLYLEKIATIPITVCNAFKSFVGDSTDFEQTTEYIKTQFGNKNDNPDKSIFTHLTCATDQDNVQKVFNDVQHIIIENSLMSAGLMGDIDGGGGDSVNMVGDSEQ